MKLPVFTVLFLLPLTCWGQMDTDCKNLKKKLPKIERGYNNETLPDKKVQHAKNWLSTYSEWEKCRGWELDIDLDEKYIHFKKVLDNVEGDSFCKSCIKSINENRQRYSPAQIIESLQNCGCSSTTQLLVEAKSKIAINGTVEDCDRFLAEYPNHALSTTVRGERNKKVEHQHYSTAINGSVQECNAYLSLYPQGIYSTKVQARKDRLTAIERNSSPSLWSQGDRVCTTDNPSGQIQAVIEQWNDNKTKLKVKIIAGYEGMYKGEDIYKGNMIWIAPDGWYKCIGDENLNYDIPSAGVGGVTDRTKYKYAVGDLIQCRRWGDGNAGYNASVLDKKDGKYLVKVTKVIISGFFSTNLSPSKCTGHLRLMGYKEYPSEEGVGSVFWVEKACVE